MFSFLKIPNLCFSTSEKDPVGMARRIMKALFEFSYHESVFFSKWHSKRCSFSFMCRSLKEARGFPGL